MANSYFQFKQFIIQQDRCAMKVCTDACILGAWFARQMGAAHSILDIGSGSGLLMLMLAQQSDAIIHGIEIDPGAFEQSTENILRSPFLGRKEGLRAFTTGTPFSKETPERLSVFHGDARHYAFPGEYDFIISNPPFYENDLTTSSDAKNTAKHSTALDFRELLTIINNNLSDAGAFGVLLPFHRWERFDQLACATGFKPISRLFVRQSPSHHHFRAILHYGRKPPTGSIASLERLNLFTGMASDAPLYMLTIKEEKAPTDQRGLPGDTNPGHPFFIQTITPDPAIGNTPKKSAGPGYSAAFTALLKDYYLHL